MEINNGANNQRSSNIWLNKLEQAVEEMRLAWKRRENKPVDHHQHVDNEQHIQSDAPILKKSSMTEFDPPKHSTTAANVEQNQSLEKDSKVTQQTSMTEITIQKQTSESEIKIQKQTSTTEIHISGNTSMDDLTMITVQTSEEQILEEEYEEEVISSGIIIPIKSPIRQQLSPRDKKQEFINEQSNPSDAQNLFQNIAKGHLLKHENNFIPELPTAIPPVANESSSKLPAASTKSQDYDDEEEDDEIDNLYQQRYLKKNPPDTNKPKLNDIKVDELPSEQQSEISQSNEKKRSWLDMILN